jgi:hypothetical protein
MTRAPLSADELGTLRGVTEAAAPNALVMVPREIALRLLDMAEALPQERLDVSRCSRAICGQPHGCQRMDCKGRRCR